MFLSSEVLDKVLGPVRLCVYAVSDFGTKVGAHVLRCVWKFPITPSQRDAIHKSGNLQQK